MLTNRGDKGKTSPYIYIPLFTHSCNRNRITIRTLKTCSLRILLLLWWWWEASIRSGCSKKKRPTNQRRRVFSYRKETSARD